MVMMTVTCPHVTGADTIGAELNGVHGAPVLMITFTHHALASREVVLVTGPLARPEVADAINRAMASVPRASDPDMDGVEILARVA